MPNWTGNWSGGRTYVTSKGQTVWMLRKTVLGNQYQIKLDANSEADALAELAMFNRDPAQYQTRTQAVVSGHNAPIYIDVDNVRRFLEAKLEELGKDGDLHVRSYRRYLAQWAEAFAGKDFRKLKLRDLLKELDNHKTARAYRISALKSFAEWLRRSAQMDAKDDPTLDLHTPPPKAKKATREMGFSIKDVERVYEALTTEAVRLENKFNRVVVNTQIIRDILCLKAKTGMHYREIRRLAEGNPTQIRRVEGHGEIAGVLYFLHKSRAVHPQSVDAQTLAAALRIQEHGTVPSESFVGAVLKRLAKKGLPLIALGEFRHSFVTWAEQSGKAVYPAAGEGVGMELIASAVGHRNKNTTQDYYNQNKLPVMIKIPIVLRNVEDAIKPVQVSNVLHLRS